MNLQKLRRKIKNGINCYRYQGSHYFMIKFLEKSGVPVELRGRIRYFYNSNLNKNVYVPNFNFDDEFQTWEKDLQTNCRIAIQCHVFYTDLLSELKEKLNNIPYAYDLYITTDNERKAQYIGERLANTNNVRNLKIQVMPNRGRDIIPFLQQMRLVFSNYEYLCHLHTKKSLHSAKGNIWRRASYDALLGSTGQIRQIFKLFCQNEKIGLLFPHITKHINLPIDWGPEKPGAKILWQRMKFKTNLPEDIIFPAGSMMWMRTKAVKQLLSLPIGQNDVPPEKGQLTGTIMHVIERLWVYVARENGYDFIQIESQNKEIQKSEQEQSGFGNAVCDVKNFYISYLTWKLLRKINYTLNCLGFDCGYYLNKYPDVSESKINPLSHYKKHGWKEGRYSSLIDEIESEMDRHAYLNNYRDVAKIGVDPVIHYLRHGKGEGRVLHKKNDINAKMQANLNIIKNSPYWDEGWYLSYYREVKQMNIDPAMHYILHGFAGYNPGPFFNSKEYFMLNPDAKEDPRGKNVNPLLHYEKHGWKEGRSFSLAAIKEYQFPERTENCFKVFRERSSFDKHIVTILASFSGNGKVEDYILYLLKGLREVSDYIVIVCDNPLFPEETEKLGNLCDACICERHGEYDFGSYKRGIAFFEKQGIFTDEDELLLINDSCYGPVHSFVPVMEKLHELNKDFGGLSANKDFKEHIQSFFYLFSSKVYTSYVFKDFFDIVKKEMSAANVLYRYELNFTETLFNAGFSWGTLIPKNDFSSDPTIFSGLTLLKEYLYPVVKIKALQGSSAENPADILEHIKEVNPELYGIIIKHLAGRKAAFKHKGIPVISPYTLRNHYSERVTKLREKSKTSKLKVVFLVNMSSMFPAEGLMKKMLEDELFEVELYVIPEVRFGEEEMFRMLDETYKELSAKYPFTKLVVDITNHEITAYHDVVKDADLVCYPSPYDVSYSLYNPYYAVQNNILSLYINYGFPHTKYDYYVWKLYNYNNFWKVCLETESILEEYRKHGRCEACNAEVVGYAKMDRLASVSQEKDTTGRKKIIIAPHHSVEGGANEIMALSNFQKYAELFLKLPEDYPEIDFIFRPHPALFPILRRSSQWGDEKCDEYLEKMRSLPNVEYSTEGDYMEVFAKSGGIIQDCGSFLVEYFYTGKPCCYMLKEEADIENKFYGFGQECLKNCYIAYEEEDIRKFMDEVIIGGNDPMKEERDKFSREAVMLNYPHVNDVILERLKKELTGE